MEAGIPAARRRELAKILGHERAVTERGVPAGVAVQRIARAVAGPEPEADGKRREAHRLGQKRGAERRRIKASPQNLTNARTLLAAGLSDLAVAKNLGISPHTLKQWRAKRWV